MLHQQFYHFQPALGSMSAQGLTQTKRQEPFWTSFKLISNSFMSTSSCLKDNFIGNQRIEKELEQLTLLATQRLSHCE